MGSGLKARYQGMNMYSPFHSTKLPTYTFAKFHSINTYLPIQVYNLATYRVIVKESPLKCIIVPAIGRAWKPEFGRV